MIWRCLVLGVMVLIVLGGSACRSAEDDVLATTPTTEPVAATALARPALAAVTATSDEVADQEQLAEPELHALTEAPVVEQPSATALPAPATLSLLPTPLPPTPSSEPSATVEIAEEPDPPPDSGTEGGGIEVATVEPATATQTPLPVTPLPTTAQAAVTAAATAAATSVPLASATSQPPLPTAEPTTPPADDGPLHFTNCVTRTGNNATVAVPTDVVPIGRALVPGDEIAVFTPDGVTCVGVTVWTGENIALTVWGDDTQTEAVDGMRAGERMLLKVWSASDGREFLVHQVTFSMGDGIYAMDSIHVIDRLELST